MAEIGNLFASAKEQTTPLEGSVKGIIPAWLSGRLMRVGPGLFDMDEGFAVNHFLDGFAMISKFEIKNGKVTYCQKLIESESYQKAMAVKRPIFAEFGTHAYPDTTKGFLYRMFSTLVPTDLTDNNVAALYRIEDELFAASETCFVHTIDCESLGKKERHDLLKSCGTMFNTPHPIVDSEMTTWNIGATMLTGCKYHLTKIPFIGSGKASDALKDSKIVATIPSSWKTCLSFISSFVMTENYVIFMEQPLLINCVKLAQIGIKGKALRDTFEWTPSEKNCFKVIEKETGNVIKTRFITDEPLFVLHHINAYERDDQIIIDLVAYPSPEILDKFNLSSLRENKFSDQDPSRVHRFVIPLIHYVVDVNEGENLVTLPDTTCTAMKAGDAIVLRSQVIGDSGLEVPTINPRFIGKPYRYFYGSGLYDQGHYKNSICKYDVQSSVELLYKVNENEFCGEPVFIPKLDPMADEDDGLVLITASCTSLDKPDSIIVLDAKTFQELGRAEFDIKIIQTLHGTFLWSNK